MPAPISTGTSAFHIPDLVSGFPFSLTYHANGDSIALSSQKWLEDGSPHFARKHHNRLSGLKAGQLAAYCWPRCADERLRVISDFITLLFYFDDISDGMVKRETELLADIVLNALWFPESYRPTHTRGKEQPEEEFPAGKLTRCFWSRCIQDGGPGFQARFREHMQSYLEVVYRQSHNQASGIIPEIETYIDERRDNGGVKMVFDLIEYGLGIDLPDCVVDDPTLKAMQQHANDFIAWSNDILSWNVEQARGDPHNLVSILMKHCGLKLQDAIDHVGVMCHQAVDSYCEERKKIPSWGPAIDKDIAEYMRGLEDWMVGSLHFSFVSERYFGKNGAGIKETCTVMRLPSRMPRIAVA